MTLVRTSGDLIRSNLSNTGSRSLRRSWNPDTKFQKQMEASQAGSLSNTNFTRYYKQQDLLYTEILRRMCNVNSPTNAPSGSSASAWTMGCPRRYSAGWSACRPCGCLARAVRSCGSSPCRPSCKRWAPGSRENGRQQLINDTIASTVGQAG